MNIRCQEDYDRAMAFAEKTGQSKSLTDCFSRLEEIAKNHDADVILVHDFAPYSFYFAIMPKNGGSHIMNGGVIYHGAHDRGGDGGMPTLGVNLVSEQGWSIHT